MSTGHANGQSLLESKHRHHIRAHVEFTGANGADPTDSLIRDGSGLLRKTAPRVERLAEGRYRLHLRNDWKRVSGSVETLSTTATHQARLEARTLTAGSCSIDVRGAIADTADDLDAIVFLVDLDLSNSDDF